MWFFEYVFAIAASTIISGAVAERANVWIYAINSALMVGFTYPVIAHWAWSVNGWLHSGAGILI